MQTSFDSDDVAQTRKGILFVLVAATLWGLSGVAGQFLFQSRGVAPQWLALLRLGVAGALLLLWAYARQGTSVFQVWREPRSAVAIIIFGVMGMMWVQLSFFLTIVHANAATATVLQFTYPALVALAVSFQLRKMPSGAMILSIALALLGSFFLATHGRIGSLTITSAALVWGTVSSLSAAFYTLYPGRLMQRYGIMPTVGWGLFIGGVCLAIFYPPWRITGVWDVYALAAAFYVVIFGSLIAFYMYLAGVQIIGGSRGSVLACAEPLSAAFFSIALLDVHFGAMDWLGTACIVCTVLILAWSSRRRGPARNISS